MPLCALPPVDQSVARVGRGFGVGWNAQRDDPTQLHAGMDFVALPAGAPVLSVLPGRVLAVSLDTGPRLSAEAARSGELGQAEGLAGYGNAVVVEHSLSLPGLPSPFWVLYCHLRDAPLVRAGDRVEAGTPLGLVGRTTNGRFPRMGVHLHLEVRRRPPPSSYDEDTIDPAVLFDAVGIDWIGHRREIEREVSGRLLIREDGPSGPAECRGQTLAGLGAVRLLPSADVPAGYLDPASPMLQSRYNVQQPRLAPRSGGWLAVALLSLAALGIGAVSARYYLRRR